MSPILGGHIRATLHTTIRPKYSPPGAIFESNCSMSPILRGMGLYSRGDIYGGFPDTLQYNNNFHWVFTSKNFFYLENLILNFYFI